MLTLFSSLLSQDDEGKEAESDRPKGGVSGLAESVDVVFGVVSVSSRQSRSSVFRVARLSSPI